MSNHAFSNHALIVAVISPDRRIHEEIESALDGNTAVKMLWALAEYPNHSSLAEIRKATDGCVVFLDFSDSTRAKAVAAELDSGYPMAAVVAVHSGRNPQELIEIMQLGIREVVTLPVTAGDVVRAFGRVAQKAKTAAEPEQEGGHVYAFLPSKPGVGATTLAVHTSAAAARIANQRTLLIDFDFRLGMTSFLFKLNGNYSVLDAIASRAQLGSEALDNTVCRRGMLDILGSGPVDFGGMDPESGAIQLLNLARKSYRTICVDLPGDMRKYEVDTLSLAQECFLVTAPDIGALHMAKRKAEALRSLGLQNRVSVVMNMTEGWASIPVRDIEAILQSPIRFSVPFAEKQITAATHAGKEVEGRSPLMTQLESIARRIVPGGSQDLGVNKRKFIEMFSVSSVRDRARWGW